MDELEERSVGSSGDGLLLLGAYPSHWSEEIYLFLSSRFSNLLMTLKFHWKLIFFLLVWLKRVCRSCFY